jgi:uncharacterized protein YggT (Ycf19 family)
VEQPHFPAFLIDVYTWSSSSPNGGSSFRRTIRAADPHAPEPVRPIRKLIPPVGGLDFSPMILLILLRIVRGLF